MGRWEPGTAVRLKDAAVELFLAHGFEQTTVPDIAARAGLTTRTFFRYFADKREVLFVGEDDIADRVAEMMDAAAPDTTPLEVVTAGFVALAPMFETQLDDLRQRRTIISSDAGLRERELRKRAMLSDRIAAGFEDRGVDALDARLIAEMSSAVFGVGLQRWLDDPAVPLADVFAETLQRFITIMESGQ